MIPLYSTECKRSHSREYLNREREEEEEKSVLYSTTNEFQMKNNIDVGTDLPESQNTVSEIGLRALVQFIENPFSFFLSTYDFLGFFIRKNCFFNYNKQDFWDHSFVCWHWNYEVFFCCWLCHHIGEESVRSLV